MKDRHRTARRLTAVVFAASALMLAVATAGRGSISAPETTRYTVVLEGAMTQSGFDLAGTREAVLALVTSAGGRVTSDGSRQIGVLAVESTNPLFDETVSASPLIDVAAEEHVWKALPSYQEAIDSGALTVVNASSAPSPPPGGGPQPHADALESQQWSMQLIRAPAAHMVQAGSPAVQVGILDSGIDCDHSDLAANVDVALARDFVPFGPGVSHTLLCEDNQFHGTHVAGIVAAKANGTGVVGVAPNVRLIPVKVCDTAGYCYSNSSWRAIMYAGDKKFEVINMSYFVDDDQFLASTEFKCMSDPAQRGFRLANERAIVYARNQGVVPVAALGNSSSDLAHPPEPYENECDVVPAETQGVIGTMALGPDSEMAYYSSYGFGMTDVAAPGGNSRNTQFEPPPTLPPCGNQVLSTIPGAWGCFQGTSMASPHAAGVAALIVSQFGRVGTDAGEPDVVMRPQQVESHLQSTTIDLLGLGQTYTKGYDHCFGNGRVDAVRAVLHQTTYESFTTEPCPVPQTQPSN